MTTFVGVEESSEGETSSVNLFILPMKVIVVSGVSRIEINCAQKSEGKH